MPGWAMASSSRLAGTHRPHLLTAVQRLDLGLLVHTHTHTEPMRILATNFGSVESLNLSIRSGWSPRARHRRCTVDIVFMELRVWIFLLLAAASLGDG